MLSSAFSKLSLAAPDLPTGLKLAIPALSTKLLGGTQGVQGAPSLNSDVSVRFKFKPRKTLSRRFPGHIDLYDKEGERQVLYAAVERYKRLDWGMYITTKTARFAKLWKRKKEFNLLRQQHVFNNEEDCLKLERMFNHELKLPRFIPDDPYEKYNRTSWWKHHWTIKKNKKLIEKYGSKDHLVTRYAAHLKFRGEPVHLKPTHYMPPDYMTAISNNPERRYDPDLETQAPADEPAPYFQRKRMVHCAVAKQLPKLKELRAKEKHVKNPIPIWSPLIQPWSYPN